MHAVAPHYLRDLYNPEDVLKQTYLSVFDHREPNHCSSIVYPAIDIGIYQWPIALAAEITIKALEQSPFEKNISCLYEQATFDIYSPLVDRSQPRVKTISPRHSSFRLHSDLSHSLDTQPLEYAPDTLFDSL